MLIKYGLRNNNIDVTSICMEKLCPYGTIVIPKGDCNRCILFSDPIFGKKKSIFVIKGDSITEYDAKTKVNIDINDEVIINSKVCRSDNDDNLKIKYGLRYDNIDVTVVCVEQLLNKNLITIPADDANRNFHFSDPLFGVEKYIFIMKGDKVIEYDAKTEVSLDIINEGIYKSVNDDLQIKYGVRHNNIDVTSICMEKLHQYGMIIIPEGDFNRSALFSDPIFGVEKYIFLSKGGVFTQEYDAKTEIIIDLSDEPNLYDLNNDLQNLLPPVIALDDI